MPYIDDQLSNTGILLGTTNIWELSGIEGVDLNSPEGKQILVRLYQNICDILNALNLKDSGYYVLQQFVDGQQFFSIDPANPNILRPNYRFVMNVTPINAGVNTFAHGIPNIDNGTGSTNWTFTRIYATATNSSTIQFYPAGTGGAAAGILTINANATNVVITNNTGVVFDKCIVVLEFLKY